MSGNPECPSCNVEMVDYTVNMAQMGTSYPGVRCPKCGRVMMHQRAMDKMTKEFFEEGPINALEVERITSKIKKLAEPDLIPETEMQVIEWRVRETTKYHIKSDVRCPRCGRHEGIDIIKMRKSGKDMLCRKCNTQWFYEYPEKK